MIGLNPTLHRYPGCVMRNLFSYMPRPMRSWKTIRRLIKPSITYDLPGVFRISPERIKPILLTSCSMSAGIRFGTNLATAGLMPNDTDGSTSFQQMAVKYLSTTPGHSVKSTGKNLTNQSFKDILKPLFPRERLFYFPLTAVFVFSNKVNSSI